MITLYLYEKNGRRSSEKTDNLIKESLKRHFGEENAPEILRTPLGKPYVERENTFLGVTHTENLVIVGIADENFGIDAENVSRRVLRPEKLAERFFTKKEKEYVLEAEGAERKRRFLEIWVKKEAYVKWLGTGLKDLRKADTARTRGTYQRINIPEYEIFVFSEKETEIKIAGRQTEN